MTPPDPTRGYRFPMASARLTYRKLTMDDVEEWQQFFIGNNYLTYVGVFDPKSPEEEAIFWLKRQIARYATGLGILAACDHETDAMVGQVGIIYREDIDGSDAYEIGYSVLPAYWGKGYATEMGRCFADVFQRLQLAPRAISTIHINNIPSQRVAEKMGMRREKQFEFNTCPSYLYVRDFPSS